MAKGINARVLLKKNSTWGAGATMPTSGMYEVPFTAEGFDVVQDDYSSNNLSNSRAPSTLISNGSNTVGTLTGDALYTRLDHVIAAIMGPASTVAATGADTGAYTNTYAPSTATPITLDASISKGNIPASKHFSFKGLKEKKLQFSWKDRGPVTVAADFYGYDEVSASGGDNAPGSDVTLVKDPISCGAQMTVRDLGTGASGDYCLKGMTLTLEQPLSEDDYCNGADTPAEPDLDGFISVTGEMLVKWTDKALYNDFRARTDLTAEIKFVSTSLVVGGGALYRTLDILLNKMRYTKALVLVDTPGLLIAKVGFKCYGSGGSGSTAEPIAFKTINEVKADTAL